MRLEAQHVSFRYDRRGPWVLEDLSLAVDSGERLGLFAPSGYGKSTLALLLSGYLRPQAGQILLDGAALPRKGFCPVQLIYQHPEKAINPRWRLRRVLEESGRLRPELLEALGIEPAWLDRFPRELSGGELQRFCIARALAVEPDILLMDEATSALDPISTSKIEDLIADLKEQYTIVIVTHNMQQAARISDNTAFFLLGDLVEFGKTEQIFSMPTDKRTEDYITGRFG